jgi:hypothetical protein
VGDESGAAKANAPDQAIVEPGKASPTIVVTVAGISNASLLNRDRFLTVLLLEERMRPSVDDTVLS